MVAVSGGADSIVLLDILNTCRERMRLELHVAHLDHGLRPDSASDADLVVRFSRQCGLPYTRERLPPGDSVVSSEDGARAVRYAFLDRTAAAVGARFVVLGHHADDQAETVLMRLLRGSGVSGLAGMASLRDGRYLRPLLSCRRGEIEAYALSRGLQFHTDRTNADIRHLRNRVRHRLLPQLRTQFNPRIVQTLCRSATVLGDEDRFLADCTEAALREVVAQRTGSVVHIARAAFEGLHLAVRRRILRHLITDLAGGSRSSFQKIEEIVHAVSNGHSGCCHLCSNLWYQVTGDQLILRQGRNRSLNIDVAVPGGTVIDRLSLRLSATLTSAGDFASIKSGLSARRAAFDADLTGPRLQLRTPRRGDRFQPLGMEGRKRVSEFLLDSGVPKILREDVLLLTSGEEVVWVAGLLPAHPFRVQPKTRKIMMVDLQPLCP